jgi:hypothetical protein
VAAAILDDFYHIACDFGKISLEHVSRYANVVAHELARRSQPSGWMDDSSRFYSYLFVRRCNLGLSVFELSKKGYIYSSCACPKYGFCLDPALRV